MKLSWILFFTLVPLFPLQAQFRKFKSATDFNPPPAEKIEGAAAVPQPIIPEEIPVPDDDNYNPDSYDNYDSGESPAANTGSGRGSDVFGRGTGIVNVQKGADSKKYVNLNPETAFGPEVITSFDFPDADILDITKHMQKLTGLNLILGKNVKGKISISAPSAITVGDAWKAYLTALNINGFSLIKSGAFYQVVENKDIRYTPSKIYSGNYTPDTDNYVMKIIPLKYISAKEIDRNFRPLMSRFGRMIMIEQTNTIIIHDTGTNINRMAKLIEFLDVPGHDESLVVIPVKHSSAQEIAKLLQDILQEKQGANRFRATSPVRTRQNDISKIIAEPRTNSIIAMTNADGARELRDLINKLDVRQAVSGGGKIHVHYLNYGDSKTIAATLNKIVSNAGVDKSGNRLTTGIPRPETGGSLFSAEVKVESDEDNNALVVTASPTDWLTMKSVIAKLDIPRDQVYVEGLIMETSIEKQSAFGISVIGGYGTGAAQRGAIGNPTNLMGLIGGQFTSLGGLFSGFGYGKQVDLKLPNGQTVKVNSINGLITAIAENNNANVLATPQILALDNTEANFEVGESRPFRQQNTTMSGITSVTSEQQKVALKLKIKPHINKVTRFVRLEITQDITEFAEANPESVGLGSSTINRLANTTIVVRDRDTIAMGGLMRDRTVANVTKVPLLGDIPILGWLFKSSSKRIVKVNLLFFLTPKILASYQKTAAKNLKDVLNRRSVHLENALIDDDAFASTTKGLFLKAKKQDEGPLYDKDSSLEYIQNNSADGIGRDGRNEDDEEIQEGAQGRNHVDDATVPNYEEIVNNLNKHKANPEAAAAAAQQQQAAVSAPAVSTPVPAPPVPAPAPVAPEATNLVFPEGNAEGFPTGNEQSQSETPNP